jgi:hypothetical protein
MRISATILILAGAAFAAHADDDDARAFTTPRLPLYEQECGSCHLAYPPGMLPARSWVSMLDGLADHFGQNAELSPTATATLSAYLRAEAAAHQRAGVHEEGPRRDLARGLGPAGGAQPRQLCRVPSGRDDMGL